MRRVSVFSQVTLDGYFSGENGDISWAHKDDPEWNAFVAENARGEGELLLGRITYEIMASFWPTPQGMEANPTVAAGINRMPKVVFSRTLDRASWNNARVVKGDPTSEVRRMKEETGPDMAVLGSGSIVTQLARAGLVDEYQIVVCPVVLGKGQSLFEGVDRSIPLRLTKTRSFGNGNVVLWYEPTTA